MRASPFTLTALGLTLLGCAGEGIEEVTETLECARHDRAGSFRVTYQERAPGTCGPLPAAVIDFSEIPSECERVDNDEWSTDQCTLERTLECSANGFQVVGVTKTTADLDANRLTGTYSTEIVGLCSSVYDISAVKE